ncbi:hypothetical protein BDR07DRAFT_1431835 [Suillus spraguei]|nr:hypothetical protein BDR07DRAFT_1431835 [Suillus spraguei]
MRLLVLLCISLYFVEVIQAQAVRKWSLISSCIFTLFACIYTAIHTNIPSPQDSTLRILRRHLGIMIMALIAPELIVTWAMRQWFSARRVTRQFEELGYPSVRLECEDNGHITLSRTPSTSTFPRDSQHHDSTLGLLGVHLKVPTSRYEVTRTVARPFEKFFKAHVAEQSEDHTWTQTHSFFVLMGGFMLYVDDKPYHTLQPDQLIELIREECIDAPVLTEKQICDRSKGNAISKGLIMLQVVWFVMQLITRPIYGLNVTQLEVGTLAFAVLNFLTYAVWWNKPLGVQCPHPVYWKSTESTPDNYIEEPDVHERAELAPLGIFAPVFASILELIGWFAIPTSRKLRVPTFDGSIKLGNSDRMFLQLAGLIMATIFGSIHLIAWSFKFVSYQGVLWHASAIAVTFTPWLCFLVNFFDSLESVPNVVHGFVSSLVLLLSVVVYITARALILALMFTTLRDLPTRALWEVSWASLVPHL